ncbi:Avirulence (Avh) protein [Phytophthora megakarya]|uniref:Avirulence (Avh) protein n=1 Tax=Phytophthora megakarya TaxID=4795 RepID=A0A225VCY3_9STRA|nr:Avirulence (Avh) protein [Phytophthora megakarya]
MFEVANQVKSTKSIATRLQTEQMAIWKSKGLTVDDLFTRYKLDSDSNPFDNPAINILGRYSNQFNPNKKTTLFTILQQKYSDETLSHLLAAARKNSRTADLAEDLQTQQLNVWLQKLETPQTVFKFLELDKRAYNLLVNPQLMLWFQYANTFEENTKKTHFVDKPKTTLIEMLMSHYDDKAMAIMLNSAKTSYSKKMAVVVEGALLDRWATTGKPLEYVTQILGTSHTKAKLLEPVYLEKLTKQQFRVWLDKPESPETIFKILHLDKKTDKLLDNPQLKTWIKYTDIFRAENPHASQINLNDMLLGRYSDETLWTILKSANTDYSTRLASKLEDALLNKWANDGKSVQYAMSILMIPQNKKRAFEATYVKKLETIGFWRPIS